MLMFNPITKAQIQELRDTQSPITGNCAYLCALALGERAHTEVSREEALRCCGEIISARRERP